MNKRSKEKVSQCDCYELVWIKSITVSFQSNFFYSVPTSDWALPNLCNKATKSLKGCLLLSFKLENPGGFCYCCLLVFFFLSIQKSLNIISIEHEWCLLTLLSHRPQYNCTRQLLKPKKHSQTPAYWSYALSWKMFAGRCAGTLTLEKKKKEKEFVQSAVAGMHQNTLSFSPKTVLPHSRNNSMRIVR